MALYTATLQNMSGTHFVNQYTAGTLTLTITFFWPDQIQEQYTRLTRFFTKMANANPFINDETGNIVRSYDVLDVLENGMEGYHPSGGKTFEEWQEWATNLIGDLKNQYEYMTEMLAWNLLVYDGSSYYSSILRIGGVLSADDDSWSMYFDTTKSDQVIGQDDLDLVTMYIQVS